MLITVGQEEKGGMVTTGKARFKKILSKGLSGWEAGRLVFQEAQNRLRGKGALSDGELVTLKMSFKTPEDRETYNSLLQTGIEVERNLHLALSGGRLAAIHLLTAHLFIKDCRLDQAFKQEGPLLVTQKQYEELKDKRKKELLKKAWTLKEVIKKRIHYLDSQASYTMEDSWDDAEDAPDEFVDFVKEQYPATYWQTLEELASLIREGKLSLADQGGEALAKGKELSAQDLEAIQEEAYLSGKSLYNSGLPEWAKDFDTYQVENRTVAIVQGAEPWEIDEKGYYRDTERETEEDYKKAGLWGRGPAELAAWYCAKEGTSLTKVIQGAVQNAKWEVLDFLAAKTAIDEFYEVMGARPFFSLEEFYKGFLSHLMAFNQDLKGLRIYQELEKRGEPALLINPSEIELIEPEQLKPDSSEVQKERNRIAAYGIGKGWWKRRKKARPEETEGEGEEACIDG